VAATLVALGAPVSGAATGGSASTQPAVGTARWAYVLEQTPVFAAPSTSAPKKAILSTATAQDQPNLVQLLAVVQGKGGAQWVKVLISELPNDTAGWVPRAALAGFHTVTTRLVIDRERFVATLYRDGKVVFSAHVGVGTSTNPTPAGRFYIRERISDFNDPVYGPIAFGTSARSPTLTDWPGGGVVGIHGTNAPQLIPGRISHGCIRLRNEDILRLARQMPLGTPIVIR
jgi:lipoprotein-anchoring transpeptidase ErfK/SrfK